MARWLAKAALQRAVGVLPREHFWNTQFQRYVTRSLALTDSRLDGRLSRAEQHLASYRRFSRAAHEHVPPSALEIGTGWYPIVPLALFLCGVDKVSTYDVAPLLSAERVRETISRVLEAASDGRLEERLPSHRVDRVQRLGAVAAEGASGGELLSALGIEYVVGDAASTALGYGSVELVCSNVVLEYISSPKLEAILCELRRLVAATGVMSHEIDLADQYAAFDRSITKFNFLKFSDRTWRLINNPMIPLNRLRISDYRELLGRAGFEVVDEDLTRGTRADLATVSLAPRFRSYAEDDLLVTRAWIVARPVVG